MADDVGSGAAKFLSVFSDVTSLLGTFTTPPALAGQPFLFAANLMVDLKGTSQAALVLSDFGGWSVPPPMAGQRFRRLRVDIYVDGQRDPLGNVNESDEATVNIMNHVFNTVHLRLQRRDSDTVVWGDMVTFGCSLLTEPQAARLPDGDWGMLGTATYGVAFSGWNDSLS